MSTSPPLNPIAVANYFIDLAKNNNKKLTPLKLQKLIYFSHAWCLKLFDQPLIDEAIEAWPYGPVIPSVYHTFKGFGNNTISKPGESIDIGNGEAKITTPKMNNNDTEKKALLDKIWEQYSKIDAITLSNMTHQEGSPWSVARTNAENSEEGLIRNLHISNKTIQSYFQPNSTTK
jgi:uncharacterized phage-associated protein